MLLVVLSGAAAPAATFSVDPIKVTIAKSNASESVAVTNQSAQKLRLQISGFSWAQDAGGQMQLAQTDDLVFFPQLLTLEPGETRRVRIGSTAQQGSVEKTFRVFMEELPSLESITNPKGAQLTIRMKVGIPVFIAPSVPAQLKGEVRGGAVRGGVLSFDVANTGNTHFPIQQVQVTGMGAAGRVFHQDITGWYVLAGGVRRFSIPLAKARCEALRSVDVRVQTDTFGFSNAFTPSNKQCGAGSAR
jgi:fimbrial chaperone protein